MRAVQVTKLGGPQAVELVEIPEPQPAADEILVDVHDGGLACPDVLQTRGLYQYIPALPFTLGTEVAGTVRSAPPDSRFAVGDRVAGLRFNRGLAEVAC
nr:alcohol dehydrogenase catalytic domain-containing protein [Sporichthya sp.]